ncbi:MAG: hypothetical protein AVDCRST_MAG45-1699, partial [uncultured Solirubrobacterales bacterium]
DRARGGHRGRHRRGGARPSPPARGRRAAGAAPHERDPLGAAADRRLLQHGGPGAHGAGRRGDRLCLCRAGGDHDPGLGRRGAPDAAAATDDRCADRLRRSRQHRLLRPALQRGHARVRGSARGGGLRRTRVRRRARDRRLLRRGGVRHEVLEGRRSSEGLLRA